jgi:hypothetical protein
VKTYREYREEALRKLGTIPSDHEGMDAMREKVWVEIRDLQLDLMVLERNGDDPNKIKNALNLRYAMSTILTRAIRKEKRDDPQRSISAPEPHSRG